MDFRRLFNFSVFWGVLCWIFFSSKLQRILLLTRKRLEIKKRILEMAGKGLKCLEMASNSLKLLDMTENGRIWSTWLEMVGSG